MSLTPVKVKDYLEHDDPIRGQSFACISFVCPEKILNDRNTFFFSKFLCSFSDELTILFDNLALKFPESAGMIENIRDNHDFVKDHDAMQEKLRVFVSINSAQLDDEFHKKNDFQTTIRGLKIRGVYASLEEARSRCEKLKILDPNHNIWVGKVGSWLPFADNPDELKDQEYAETALNTLMKSYHENQEMKDAHFAERTRDMKEKIAQENKLKREVIDLTGDDDEPPAEA